MRILVFEYLLRLGVLTQYTSGVRPEEWPIMSGIALTRIGLQLVGRCVPVPIYYFGLVNISIGYYSENWLVS